MKQSCCLSLIICQNTQWRDKVSFPQSPRSYKPANPLQITCIQYIEIVEKRWNAQGLGSYSNHFEKEMESQPSATGAALSSMTFGWGDPLHSFSTWIDAHLERNYLKAILSAKKWKSRWPGPLGEVATRNFAKREQFGSFFPCAPRQIPCVSRHFRAYFGALSGVQNVPKWACWKSCPV